MSSPAVDPRGRTRARTPGHRRMRAWLIGIAIGVVVIVVVTALVGGFGNRTAGAIPRFRAGAAIDAGEVDVRVTGVHASSTRPGRGYGGDHHWLILSTVLTNHTDEPVDSSTLQLRVQTDGIRITDHPVQAVRSNDGADLGGQLLQPDLPTRVLWLWQLTGSGPKEGAAVISALIAEPREYGNPIFGDDSYGDFEIIGQVDLNAGAPT